MNIDEARRVVEMLDKRTKKRVFLFCSKEKASEIFFNRKQNKRFDIVGTMPEYMYEHYVATGIY